MECGRKGNWEHAWNSSLLVSLMKLKCYVFSGLSWSISVCVYLCLCVNVCVCVCGLRVCTYTISAQVSHVTREGCVATHSDRHIRNALHKLRLKGANRCQKRSRRRDGEKKEKV